MAGKYDTKIFLVDDDALCLHLYRQFLKQLGYTNIFLFDNGIDCLENVSVIQPSVVFLDYNMDEMNGIDVMKQIKAINESITVLFISGQEDIEVAVNALRQGALDYIVKSSLNPDKMRAIMDKVLPARDYSEQPSVAAKPSLLKRIFS